jgi:hypothetical protein
MRRYVPERPGPLLRSRRDEDEQVLDDLFGPADPNGPGAFDVLLVVAGLGLLVGGIVAGQPVLDVFGAIALLLGLVLPLRTLARRRAAGRTERRPGLPLDTTDPLVGRLVTAYDDVFASDAASAVAACPAVHLAAVEVATLLAGGTVGGPAQHAYVSQRVELIERVQAQLASGQLEGVETTDPREAEALGRLELELSTHSSLEALQRLTRSQGEPPS